MVKCSQNCEYPGRSNTLTVTVTNKPCLLLEAVELLYAYVNRIPTGELTSEGNFSIPGSCVEELLSDICGCLDREDPQLQFFFRQEALLDGSGLYTCLARNMVRNTLDFSCDDVEESLASLRRGWALLRSRGERITSIGENSLDYMDQESQGFVPLSEDMDQLAVSGAYRKKLLEAFSGYDEYLERLAVLLRPVARQLEQQLQPWVKRAEPLVAIWQEHYSQPEAAEKLLRSIRYSETVPLKAISVCLRYLGDKAASGRLDMAEESILLHTGVARVPQPALHTEPEDWEFHAFRLLGSPARMKMLRAMLKKPMTTREMAQQLQMHLGTVGRDVSSLYEARLVMVEPVNGRNFYRTNTEALAQLARRLLTLPELEESE